MSSTRSAVLILALTILAAVGLAYVGPALAGGDTATSYADAEHLQGIDPDTVDWQSKDEAFWEDVLSAIQVQVCREGGTERAFTGYHNRNKQPGTYHCASCGQLLFRAEHKFDSGTGWPSYYQPATADAVTELTDTSYGMIRTEVRCSRCGAHLGHVFDDGPEPTGRRYCINSVCLLHKPTE